MTSSINAQSSTDAGTTSGSDSETTNLQQQLQQAREEAELTLEQLHLVQEELEIYFLRCEELQEQLASQQGATPHTATDQAGAAAAASGAPLPLEAFRPLLPLLSEQLTAEQLTNLARSCNLQHRHDLALPLLDAAVAKSAGADPMQAAWRQLQATRTRLALGQWDRAWQSLTVMAEQQQGRPAIQRQVHQLLGWLALQRGQVSESRHQLDCLSQLEPDPAFAEELSALQQAIDLAAQLPAAVADCPTTTRMPREQPFGLSLDLAVGSPTDPWLYLEGWLLDPQQQLTALLLAHGSQMIRLAVSELVRHQRSDLADLLQQHGLHADHPAGFRIALPADTLTNSDQSAPDSPPKLGLIALRAGQPPVLLARPFAPADNPAPSLYALAASTLHSTPANPADLTSWSFPAGC